MTGNCAEILIYTRILLTYYPGTYLGTYLATLSIREYPIQKTTAFDEEYHDEHGPTVSRGSQRI